jgi:plastocyanin
VRIPLVAIAVLALAGACGGGTPATAKPPASSSGGGATSSPAAGAGNAAAISCNDGGTGSAAEIFDLGFRPNPIAASSDLTVTWTNTGALTHDITFDNGGPDCGHLAPTDLLSVLFPGPGSYAYHCSIHATMKGTVTVS